MKCQYCSKEAVYHRKISNEYICKNHFCLTVEKKIRKTVRKYKMFSPQQKVVVGLSGGKDSLVLLLNILYLQEKYPQSPRVEAILIDEGIMGYRNESITIAKDICQKWKVKLHIISFENKFGSNLDSLIPKLPQLGINACTICGTIRRRLLNEKALELKSDKLAIGHNLDDQVETFLQNILRNDLNQIIQHPPNGNIDDPRNFFVPRIKPMMNVPEEEITRYCYYKKIPIQTNPCPYSENFFILRKEIQIFINNLEKNSAEVKFNLIKMNEKLLKSYSNQNSNIPTRDNKFCENCGNPKGYKEKNCYYCILKKKLIP